MKINLSTKLVLQHLILVAVIFTISLIFIPKSILLAFTLALLCALISGFSSSHKITRSILSLRQTLSRQMQNKVEEINQEKNKVSAIVSSLAEGLIACDTESRILLINKAAGKLFSVETEQSQGKMFLEAIRNHDLDSILSSVLTTGVPQRREITILVPVQKAFHIQASPLTHENKISGAVLVLHDITELKRLENMRQEFISNVSHELRTPLTSIKGFAETLLSGALEDKNNNRRFVSIIDQHAIRLGKLIDDLLELSKIESGEEKLAREIITLPKLIQEVIESFSPQLTKAKIHCVSIITEKLPTVTADHDKIKQVMINLLDNAIKFNKENGDITVSAEILPNYLKVKVADTGSGIPLKDLSRLFERFYRVDKARSRELGGTGLGLSIVKHIIEAHGGQVGVESVEEKGSTFWFTLPIAK